MATSATITTEPNKLLAEKTDDDRMPVIVKRQDYEKWIEPGDEARPPIDRIRPIVNATVSTPESERSAMGLFRISHQERPATRLAEPKRVPAMSESSAGNEDQRSAQLS
jgi:putative SOS response-associated peptidase YedK